jgi:ATP-dependent Lon protease
VKDLAEIPDNVKNVLEIRPVKWIDEVLALALEHAPTALADDAPQPVVAAKDATPTAEAVVKH